MMDELCFSDIDKLFGRLSLNWDDFYAAVNKERGLPHETAGLPERRRSGERRPERVQALKRTVSVLHRENARRIG